MDLGTLETHKNMRSLYDQIVEGAAVNQYVDSTDKTSTSAVVDTMGYATAVLRAVAGKNSTADAPTTAVTLLECATATGQFTAALANDGNAIGFNLTGHSSAGSQQSGMVRVEGLGLNRKRYLKVQIETTVASGNLVAAGSLILGRSHKLPPTSTVSADV